MICERCQRPTRIIFFVEDQEAWSRLSPYGDARGVLCLECADDLAAENGLANVPVLIGFWGKALMAPSFAAMHGSMAEAWHEANRIRKASAIQG